VAAAKAWQLGLAVALAARDACLPFAPVALKWPNDLVDASGAKLGGLLIETILDGEGIDSAVIGVGINVNWDRAEMPAELAATATSLRELGGSPVDRVALLGSLAAALERRISDVEGGRAPLDEYRAACSTLGAMVTVETAGGIVTGRALAIEDGGVLVLEGAGGIVRIANGELVRLVPGAAA
jgi:BirA family biotin operon repressor/biotin-[acetyl-CoA-carboxylase] ligase